jgi:spermidine/putrescine transport system permease protein
MAFALVRHRFRGAAATNLLIFLPMATPEIVMGSSLLALFVAAASRQLGFWTILDRAHHVLPVVRRGHRQGAAGRLDSRSSRRRWTSTPTSGRRSGGSRSRWCSPASWPRRCCASRCRSTTSSSRTQPGNTITFPMFVWGSAQRGIPPQVNVVGTVMFLMALLLVLGGGLLQRRRPA